MHGRALGSDDEGSVSTNRACTLALGTLFRHSDGRAAVDLRLPRLPQAKQLLQARGVYRSSLLPLQQGFPALLLPYQLDIRTWSILHDLRQPWRCLILFTGAHPCGNHAHNSCS